MGFRQNGYMMVWAVEPSKSGNTTKVRLSSSRKNKNTDKYEQDFSGFCTFIGDAHKAASHLKERDRIKILECDVGTTYDKENKREYVNYKVFSFEMADGGNSPSNAKQDNTGNKPAGKRTAFDEEGDTGEMPF